jgi:hypothetical protein
LKILLRSSSSHLEASSEDIFKIAAAAVEDTANPARAHPQRNQFAQTQFLSPIAAAAVRHMHNLASARELRIE